ncbi:MAG: PDZ domain-containing protein, partial [Rhodobacteraceae bacterium]|nr:PDZ domain-containing protein [Paracoccaceae bacterium]
NVVSGVTDQLEQYGETRRGWLGVRIQTVTQDIADAIGLEQVAGALVTDVPDGPAADGGIEAGDVILRFDGQEVESTRELVRLVAKTGVGSSVRVLVFRDGGTETLLVTLGRLEEAVLASADGGSGTLEPAEAQQFSIQGLLLGQLTSEYRERFMISEETSGVVILEVEESSQAAEKGLRAGDVITEVSQNPVRVPKDVVDRIEAASDAGRRSILLLVRSGGSGRFVALTLAE